MDKVIKVLENMAKEEKYYEGMASSINNLKAKVVSLKENYLNTFEKEIRFMLKEEITSPYYFHSGIIEAGFSSDSTVIKAAYVLNDSATYNTILNN